LYLLDKPKSKKIIGNLNEDFIDSLNDIDFFWDWNDQKKKKIQYEDFLEKC
jgi:hypothetical protein